MNKNILNYIEECEAWKVGIKNLHWSADNLSQHELCDDIADEISNFEDLVSEVEQSISGKIKLNGFTPKSYKITSLKSFVEDVISASQSFLKELEGMGEKYVGIKSECETFIGTMQRKLYLVNFTLKEELKKRLRDRINESRPKNLANTEDVEKFMGRRPKTIKARINQIYRIVKKYGIDSRKYHDEAWQAIDDYYRAITSLGCDVELKPCGHLNNADSMESDGGYCDYDPYDHMPRSKQYAIKIMFDDGMNIEGYIKCMAAGTVEDPFASYDTCMVLWPKSNNVLETKNMSKQMRLTESELKTIVREAAMQIINEYTQKQANTKGFIRSTHGHGDISKHRKKATPEERAEARRKLGIPEPEKVEEESIDIDPKNKGKFTATKKATGKSTEELTHSKNPLTRKRANFAKMAKRGWKPLKESEYMDDGNLESQYGKNPDSMWTYGTNLNPSVVDGLEPNQVRHAGNGNIKNDNNASWDYFDAVSNGADMKMRNRLDADYRERTNNSPFNVSRKRMDMDVAFPRQTPNERFKQDLDKQWKDTQDVEKYSRQADSRPLHRKGSLNRV
jgi:hypothetical protein